MCELSLAALIAVKRQNLGAGRLGMTAGNRGLAWLGRLARTYGAVVVRWNVPSGLAGTDPRTSVVYRFPSQAAMLAFVLVV